MTKVRIWKSSQEPTLPFAVTAIEDGRTLNTSFFPSIETARRFAYVQNVDRVEDFAVAADAASQASQLNELHELLDCIHSPGCRLELDDYLEEVDEDSLGTLAKTLLDCLVYYRDLRNNYEELCREILKLPTIIKP